MTFIVGAATFSFMRRTPPLDKPTMDLTKIKEHQEQ